MATSGKPGGEKASGSALSSVVNDLIRAAAGGDARDVADDDLDKFVADLILKEAAEKKKKYNDIGVRAYSPNPSIRPSDMPKPNKRFLLNMVKATDSHNQAVIRAAERNASRAHQRLHHRDTSSSRHRRRSRSRSSSSSPSRKRTRTSTRSRSPSDSRSRSRCDDGGSRTDSDEEDSMDERREYDRYRENRSSQKRPHSRSPDRRPKRSLSVSPARKLGGKVNPSSKPVQIRGRGKISMNRSAMDKYFQDEYDPSKDIPSDEDQYVFAKETDTIKAKKDKKKKKKKSKKSKKSKKHKHDKRSSDDSLSASDFDAPTVVMPKPSIRAWDIGKTSFDH